MFHYIQLLNIWEPSIRIATCTSMHNIYTREEQGHKQLMLRQPYHKKISGAKFEEEKEGEELEE